MTVRVKCKIGHSGEIFLCIGLSIAGLEYRYGFGLNNGLLTLPDPDSDSDSDSKPYGYIVLFRTFHIGSDPDRDPFPLVFV